MPRRAPEKSSWKSVFRLPAFFIANIALFVVIGVTFGREAYRGWSTDHEIKTLEAEVEQLEGRRLRLESLTEQLVSEEHVELEARARLGRQKTGERVVVLYGLETTSSWSGEDVFGDVPPTPVDFVDTRTNPQKWWDYFRGIK